MIRVMCPGCAKGIKVPPEMGTAPFACPGCGTLVDPEQHRVPQAAESAKLAAPEAPPIVLPTAAAIETTPANAPDDNPFKSPQNSDAGSAPAAEATGPVTITGIRIPFTQVFRLAFYLWVSFIIFGFGLWLIALVVVLLLDAMGVPAGG